MANTTVTSALKVIRALRKFSKDKTLHNNIVTILISDFQSLYNISDLEMKEGLDLLQIKKLACNVSQGQRNGPPLKCCQLHEIGRDLSEEQIERMLIQPNVQSHDN